MKWLLVLEAVGIVGMVLASVIIFGAPLHPPEVGHTITLSTNPAGSEYRGPNKSIPAACGDEMTKVNRAIGTSPNSLGSWKSQVSRVELRRQRVWGKSWKAQPKRGT